MSDERPPFERLDGDHPPDDLDGPVAPTLAPPETDDRSRIRDPLPQPLLSRRRLVILLVLLVAAGLVVAAGRAGGDTDPGGGEAGIASFSPAPGGRVLRQATVGVILEQGHDGRITIDGVEIPELQMEGAIQPDSDQWRGMTEEQRSLGPRPNTRERVLFRPGPGQVIETLGPGEVRVTVRYWRMADGEDSARTFSYTIYAS